MIGRRRFGRGGDRGQVTLLTIGYAVIALLLVTVVVNLSRVFLAQRALDSAADEAALAGVQTVQTGRYYGEGAGRQLPLAGEAVRSAVEKHLRASAAGRTCDAFALDGVRSTTTTVTVRVSCRVRIPFANVVSARYADGVPITGVATARQTVRD